MESIFSKNKSKDINQLHLTTDIHNHTIPGIDDGSGDIEESIEMLKAYHSLGYTKIIATPHVHSERYWNTTENILAAANELMIAKEKEKIPIDIVISAEYYADENLLDLLNKNDILSINNKYLLCEFNFYYPPADVKLIATEIINAGYKPILAHPERYEYWNGNIMIFEKLKEYGFLFQCNIPSAAGYYGVIARNNFNMLANKGFIDFLGTDAHDAKSILLLGNIMQSSLIKKILPNILNYFL
jgi:tyrosine-protein phosphatase YwqE